MKQLIHFICHLSIYMKPHLREIAMAMVATLLVVFGDTINRSVKNAISSLPLVLRIVVFVLVASFGVAWFSILSQKVIYLNLRFLDDRFLAPVVIGVFIVIGIIAEHRKYV